MENLYVVEQGSFLAKSGDTLKIVKQGTVLDTVPAKDLTKLILTGHVSLTGPVMDYLIRHRVETVFLTPTGRFRARLMIDEHRHVALRKAQYERLSDPNDSLNVMKIIVQGKLENMAAFLLRRGRDYNEPKLKAGAAALTSLTSSLKAAREKSIVRGIEGAGSRIYFSVFPLLIRNDVFFFNGRNRRPPKDPVNALLSFVYTLLTNEVISAIKTCGLDPYLGALHEISYGRPSLACDLVEEYRAPVADRFVLQLLNRKMIKPEDFVYRKPGQKVYTDEKEMASNRPVEMKPRLYKTFLAAYEQIMQGPAGHRNTIQAQVRTFADFLLGKKISYRPVKL
ncbi:CRISPR-associated endonuclease Cas1 [Desulfotignum phosphitoxidans]|uniref:CRISPR-associated endonuclease Cas1 n=1 Tax=Desulfotignum phosphitoxidans DSM 13687 TaxID=1286635 RepID=S0G6Q9_9BACT|nr:CRISPR-associated endonuclease Cas1 [Desulfotignum phosphitoxidans]EMS78523.1 CRISPR-associated endonuclease Cas1 [Desulfotignum phosphitoxidans DSM 13687]EMS80206.1 CRISPR-associated endonuclease Cas1 [Desulfotignum phosphitoxidans DSM 13687]